MFLTKSAPSTPASWREFVYSFCVFIYLILTWKQSVIHWRMCGESRIPKRWCNEIMTYVELHSFWLNCHQRWQLCAHPWTHTSTGLNTYIILYNNWREKSCFLSQSTVVCPVTGTLIKQARSKINILWCHWRLIWYQLWDLIILLKLPSDSHNIQSIRGDICPENWTVSKEWYIILALPSGT